MAQALYFLAFIQGLLGTGFLLAAFNAEPAFLAIVRSQIGVAGLVGAIFVAGFGRVIELLELIRGDLRHTKTAVSQTATQGTIHDPSVPEQAEQTPATNMFTENPNMIARYQDIITENPDGSFTVLERTYKSRDSAAAFVDLLKDLYPKVGDGMR